MFVQVAVRVEAVRQKPGARLHAALVDWLLRRERHGLASARLAMHRRDNSLRRCEVRWHRKIVGVKGWIKWAPLSRARRLRRRLRHAAHVDVVSLIMKPYGTPRGTAGGISLCHEQTHWCRASLPAEALQNTSTGSIRIRAWVLKIGFAPADWLYSESLTKTAKKATVLVRVLPGPNKQREAKRNFF